MPEAGTLKQLAYSQIRDWILEGELLASHPVSETVMARRLCMSRTPVRAALETLVEDGLLGTDASGTLFVQAVTVRTIREMFEMRAAIETYAIRYGDFERVARSLKRLCPLIQHYANHSNQLSSDDRSVLAELDIQLHTTIVAALDNSLMSSIYQRQLDTRMAYIHGLSWADPRRTVEAAEGHLKLAESVLRGDCHEAEAVLIDHLAAGRRYVTGAAAHDQLLIKQAKLRMIRSKLASWVESDTPLRDAHSLVLSLTQEDA